MATTKTKAREIRVPNAFETIAPAGSLFALTADYLEAQRKLAEVDLDPQTIADTLESMEGDLAVKSLRVTAIAMQFESFAEAIAQAANRMMERAKSNQRKAAELLEYVRTSMIAAGFEAGDKIVSTEIVVKLQNNPARVEIEDEKAVPGFYWRTPDTPADVIDKKAILEYLRAQVPEGEPPRHVLGCKLVQDIRLVVK